MEGTNKEEQAFAQIIKACKVLNWMIALPEDEEDNITGLIIGTDEYVNSVLDEGK